MIQHLLHEPLFWYSVAFVLFFAIVGPRIFRPLAAMLDQRAQQIRQDLDEAARLKREAEQMLAEARREREAALADAKRMIEHSREEAERIAEAARRESDLQAQRRERMAQDRIQAAERAALLEVRARAAEIASLAASETVRHLLTAEADAELVDRAIASLPASFARRVDYDPAAARPASRSAA